MDIKALANQSQNQHYHTDDILAKFHETYSVNPFIFNSLPGVTKGWDAKKMVLLYHWFIQEDRPSQSTLAQALNVDVSTISRKVKSVDWEEFEASLEAHCTMTPKQIKDLASQNCHKEMVYKAHAKAYRKEIEIGAKLIDLKESLLDSTEAIVQAKLPPFKPLKKHQNRTAEEMVLMLSDMHVGQEFTSEETGGINAFSLDICKARAANLRQALLEIFTLHRELYDIPTLHIFGLGDFVHGSNLGGQWGPAYNSIPVNEQAKIAADMIAQLMDTWSRHFKQIKFYGIIGNHGRAGAEKNSDKVQANWDDIVYTILQAKVAHHKNVTVEHSPCWWTVRNINGKKFGAIHGDFVRGSINGLTNEFDRLTNLIPEPFEYMLMGHFHRHTAVETSKGRLLVNGSFVGGDIHSMHQLKSKSQPTQTVMGVHPEHGITWTYHLNMNYDRK